ncbi:hypothetical protein [Herbaspirillum lusitanum]|uniref:hypothetical protein n=1 Tax=Herbaspirillum lusitanum TaxID=213312 RepID=UPI00031E7AE4|nr:hypothetical protein [Herbaspirillum lusitanum]
MTAVVSTSPLARSYLFVPANRPDRYDKALAPPRMDAIPALGQHTDAILGKLGYAQAEIDVLRARGAV